MKKLIFLLWCCSTVYAQTTINPTYTYILPGKWENWVLAPGGVLLVGNGSGLTAIEANNSQIIYNYNDLGKIKPEEMELIEGYPWVMLHQGGFAAASKSKKALLDYFTGKPLIESSKFGWIAPAGSKVLPEEGKVILWGSHQKSLYYLGVYDIASEKEIFTVDLKDKKIAAGVPFFDKIRFVGDFMFVPTLKNMVCINLAQKKLQWSTTAINGSLTYDFYLDPSARYVYAYNPSLKAKIYRLDMATGNATWAKPISLSGAVKKVQLIKEGLWVYSEEEKSFAVNIYNPETGQPLWKKAYSDKGGIRQTIFTDEGVVFGTSTGEVNTLLHNGTLKLKKNIETGAGYRVFTLTDNGNLFYLTNFKMGVANLQNGGFEKEPTKFRKVEQMITAYDEKNDRFVVCTGNELFFITRNAESKKICDIAFKGDENPSKIEFRESGILLSSNQNAMLVDYDGNVKYNVYYKAPGASLAAKLAAGAIMAASTSVMAVESARAGAMQGANPFYKSDAQRNAESNARAAGDVANSAAAILSQRFSATAATKNSLYIQTMLDDGVGLIRLNKDTGKPDAQIVLKDKKPEYLVDEDFGAFYYKKSDNTIIGYDLRDKQ